MQHLCDKLISYTSWHSSEDVLGIMTALVQIDDTFQDIIYFQLIIECPLENQMNNYIQ